jgi:hypothetical protein
MKSFSLIANCFNFLIRRVSCYKDYLVLRSKRVTKQPECTSWSQIHETVSHPDIKV